MRAMENRVLSEATYILEKVGSTKAEFIADVRGKEEELLEENLNDLVNDKVRLKEPYINELIRMAYAAASCEKPKIPDLKASRLDKSKFQEILLTYLITKEVEPTELIYT